MSGQQSQKRALRWFQALGLRHTLSGVSPTVNGLTFQSTIWQLSELGSLKHSIGSFIASSSVNVTTAMRFLILHLLVETKGVKGKIALMCASLPTACLCDWLLFSKEMKQPQLGLLPTDYNPGFTASQSPGDCKLIDNSVLPRLPSRRNQ